MQRLNIPFSRHTKTTSRNRQVVWLWIGLILVGGFGLMRMWTLWFNHSDILNMAPVDTILAVELHLNDRTADFLETWLTGATLISDRSIELADLSKYIHGEFALFLAKDGTRSVAIRSTKSELPDSFLSSFALSVQEQEPFILLSSTLLPISAIETNSHPPFFPSLKKTWIGQVVIEMENENLTGNLFLSEQELLLSFHTKNGYQGRNTSQKLDSDLSLGGLVWNEERSPLPGLSPLFQSFADPENQPFFLKNKDIRVILRYTDTLETLLIIKNDQITKEDLMDILEQIAAFARPLLVSHTLEDGSTFQEILVEPSLISVEEILTGNGSLYRIPMGEDAPVLGALTDEGVLISTSEMLLKDFMSADDSDVISTCGAANDFIDPVFLLDQVKRDTYDSNLAVFESILDDFSMILIETKKYSTYVHFCKI